MNRRVNGQADGRTILLVPEILISLPKTFEIQKIRIMLGISTVPMSTKSNRKLSTQVFRSVH